MKTITVRLLATLYLLLVLTACQGDNSVEQTLQAENATLSTQVAAARQTATFNAVQRSITTEFLGTQVRDAEQRRFFIIGTLAALGIDTVSVDQITPNIVPPTPRPGVNSQDNGAVAGGITRIPPTPEFRTSIPTETREATLDPTVPRLTNVSVSSSVGADDCATGSATQFDAATPGLYAVGTANRFPTGMTVTFTWLRGGELVFTDSFTWDAEVDGRCVWYNATPDQFDFLPGTYSVTFESNGVAIAPPIAFVMMDSSATAEVMTP